MARTFDLSDIIAEEVEKALTKQASTQSAGGLAGISIQDITKFLAELSKLKKQSEALAPAPAAVPAQTPAVAAPAPAQTRPSPVNVYNAVIATIDKVVPILGDMRLSEVKTYMTENKDAVISLIEANI